jgi:uncharacterized membrane protein
MSQLIAIVFEDIDEASRVRETIRKGEHADYISLDDSAIVMKDQDGKVHIKNEVDRGVKVGAVGGSLLGLLIAGIFFPIGGLVLGAIGGAIIGKLAGRHIDNDFVKEIGDSMTEGSSALFFIFRGDDPSPAITAMRPYKGKILQTTLDEESEEALRAELKDSIE